jgi:hypothetical protein
VLVFWLLGVANLFHPLLFGRSLGDIGDSRLVLFLLEHQYKLLTCLQSSEGAVRHQRSERRSR